MSNKEKPEWLEELEKAPLTSRLRRKESLKRFNTWRIGNKQVGTFAKDEPGNAVFAYEG